MSELSTQTHQNNFNILRFAAALMVISGHNGHITASAVPQFLGQSIHSIGVKIFFLIGGYLITKSWQSDPHFLRYATKRVFRIFPALIVFVAFVAFVAGPLLTTLSVQEYFASGGAQQYLWNILLRIRYGLPGVFTENIYPHAVNGSLWTLPVEMLMYIALPVVLTLVVLAEKYKAKAGVIVIAFTTLAACLFQLLHLQYFPTKLVVFYDTDWLSAMTLIPFYFIGMLFTLPFFSKLLNVQVALVALFAFACLPLNGTLSELCLYMLLPYLVFSLAFAPQPFFAKAFSKCEISYGLYLYGFFIQQLLVNVCLRLSLPINPTIQFVLSAAITIVIAIASYKLIEEPANKLCKKILSLPFLRKAHGKAIEKG